MSNIVPIRGVFENPVAMLHAIAADPAIEGFVIYCKRGDQEPKLGTFKMTRADLAFAGVNIMQASTED